MTKYLDYDGLLYLWGKVKAYIANVVPTKTSDLTNDSFYTRTEINTSLLAPKRTGTLLANGTNLNTLATGAYYSSSASVTASLTNCPITTGAFRLFVFDSGYDTALYRQQVLISGAATESTGLWFRKQLQNSGRDYSSWYKVTGTAV